MAPPSCNTCYHPYKKLPSEDETADPPLSGWLETMVRLGVCRPYHLLHKVLHNLDVVEQQARLLLKGEEFVNKLYSLSFLTSKENLVKYGKGLPVKVLDIERRVYNMKLRLLDSNKQCRFIKSWMEFVKTNQLEASRRREGREESSRSAGMESTSGPSEQRIIVDGGSSPRTFSGTRGISGLPSSTTT